MRFKSIPAVSLLVVTLCAIFLYSCGKSASNDKAGNIDDDAFYATQPLHSGLYDATYYDISGNNPRKGMFDGRIYFALSPDQSALYVYENGNRTKIDHVVTLQKPFEKNDSGIYYSVDAKSLPVTVYQDSTSYVVTFQKSGENYKISFNSKPRTEGTALDMLERMSAQKAKNQK